MDDETRLVPAQDGSALEEKEATVPGPVAVTELATKLVTALDMIAALVPDLRKPHPATASKVRGARTVSREAVSSIIAMVEATPLLQNVLPLDISRAHEVLSSMDDYRLLSERLEVFCAQVKYTSEARWAELVAQAMQALAIASTIAEDPKEAELAAHVATIRRHLGRRNATTGKRKKKPE